MKIFLKFLFIAVIMLMLVAVVAVFWVRRDISEGPINMSNIDQFKTELTNALPVGTPKTEVSKFLTARGLEFSYVDRQKQFFAIIRDVGTFRLIYRKSLLIRIGIDEEGKVKSIQFEYEMTGL